ncbi:MAG: hypothetical protein ACT4TC_17350 [Myxococcaceae bacterium]
MIRRMLMMITTAALAGGCEVNAPLADGPGATATLSLARTCTTASISPERELLIRSLSVVEDPVRTRFSTSASANPAQGAWSFGGLMAAMSGDVPPERFVREWLRQWEAPQVVNGEIVKDRAEVMRRRVLDPWIAASGGETLDLSKAPFQLLAIVNRIDLRDLSQESSGEARFVFGFVPFDGGFDDFTVILEYRIPAATEADVKAWGERWHELGKLALGTEAYNVALQDLTDSFTRKNADPMRPNGSALSQLRTNEIALSENGWELREFTLSPATGLLQQSPLAQTPHDALNRTSQLRDLVNTNEAAILAKTFTVPRSERGGVALNQRNTWFAQGIRSAEARHLFSLNTCDGCHGEETASNFHHIHNRSAWTEAALSEFMTGKVVWDVFTGQQRSFNELQRRGEDLGQLLCER